MLGAGGPASPAEVRVAQSRQGRAPGGGGVGAHGRTEFREVRGQAVYGAALGSKRVCPGAGEPFCLLRGLSFSQHPQGGRGEPPPPGAKVAEEQGRGALWRLRGRGQVPHPHGHPAVVVSRGRPQLAALEAAGLCRSACRLKVTPACGQRQPWAPVSPAPPRPCPGRPRAFWEWTLNGRKALPGIRRMVNAFLAGIDSSKSRVKEGPESRGGVQRDGREGEVRLGHGFHFPGLH